MGEQPAVMTSDLSEMLPGQEGTSILEGSKKEPWPSEVELRYIY